MQTFANHVPDDPIVQEVNAALTDHLASLEDDYEDDRVAQAEIDQAHFYAVEAVLRRHASAGRTLSPNASAALADILAGAIERLMDNVGPLPACIAPPDPGTQSLH